ncbi:MAG TPA: hypothetical protein VFW85_02630 [Gaiellaceae bacterium]|nr:hypothetical protein [Gaiellaceae bacterium]
MLYHPEIQRLLVEQKVETLRHDAQHTVPTAPARADFSRIDLRLCRVGDDAELARLAALEEVEVPRGRFVLAEVDGRLVAALALAGGEFLADPFVSTTDLRRLLELRASQLREPGERPPRFGLAAVRSLSI